MYFRQSLLSLLILAMGAPGSSLQVHIEQNSSLSSSCSCLGWAETYRTKGVSCGAVFEVGSQDLCTTFYGNIEDAVCMNKGQDEDKGQWCYVSAGCTSSDATAVNDKVSWKTCVAGQDDMTREKTVEELMDWAKKNNLMSALVMKMAFPVYPNTTWEQVKPYIDESGDSVDLASFPESMRTTVAAIMESGIPVVFDSPDHYHPPHGILEGHKIFTTHQNEKLMEFKYLMGKDVWKTPYKMTSVRLYKGH